MRAVVVGLLVLSVCVVFWPVLGHDFVSYDDPKYVTENPHVQRGLGVAGLGWALTAFHAANWHPVTWLSHMADWELYADHAAGHHFTNLLLHGINTLLLFTVLRRATGSLFRSAVVALLFGIHPLHVESVAWVAERKDVLSTCFWFLTMLAYLRYVRSPGVRRYLVVVVSLALGLCAKPMLVTLPAVLLLLDYWPLRRFPARGSGWKGMRRLVVEKLPLLALVVASSVVTVAAQQSARAVVSFEAVSLVRRVLNAVTSYGVYLAKTFWPSGLAVPYPPPPDGAPGWGFVVAAVVCAVVTMAAIRLRRGYPYLAVGWLWYVGTLVPVIGLVQVGMQARADRYTYVPLVGIFVMLAWGVPDLVRRRFPAPVRRPGLLWAGVVLACVVPLMSVAHLQVRHWRDSIRLFERALDVTTGNFVAHNGLGLELFERGRAEEAMQQYRRAMAIRPAHAETMNNIGGAHAALGQPRQAIESYRRALRARPEYPEALNNLGVALAGRGEIGAAIANFREAIRLRPDYGRAHGNLAIAHFQNGDDDLARQELRIAREHDFEPPAKFEKLLAERLAR